MNQSPTPGGSFDLDAMLSWALLIGLSLWGGFASFMRKMRGGHVRPFNITELVGELTISGFTGVLFANLCDYYACPNPLKYAIVGITAHMGSRALFMLESKVNEGLKTPEVVAPAAGGDHAA